MTQTMTETMLRAQTPAGGRGSAPRRKRSWSDIAFNVWGVLVMLFLFLPIIVIVIYSFNTGRLLVSWDGFGFDAFLTILEKPAIQSAVRVSLITAFIAATIATALGTLAGIAMARHPGKWVWWFLGLLLLVSVTPEIVDAISLLPWLVFLGQDLGISIFNDGTVRLVVGHSLFSVAVVSYIVRARLVGLPANLEEASADLYAPPLRTFRRITLPLAMRNGKYIRGRAAARWPQPPGRRRAACRPSMKGCYWIWPSAWLWMAVSTSSTDAPLARAGRLAVTAVSTSLVKTP